MQIDPPSSGAPPEGGQALLTPFPEPVPVSALSGDDPSRGGPPRPEWWRFTGIGGLKRFIHDSIMQRAEANGRKWVKWHEPVCSRCPAARRLLNEAKDD